MPSAFAKSKLTEIVEELTTLSVAQLDKLLPKLVALRLEKRKLVLPRRESELLRTINRGLTAEKRREYEVLRRKARNDTLNERERAALIKLSDELELLG